MHAICLSHYGLFAVRHPQSLDRRRKLPFNWKAVEKCEDVSKVKAELKSKVKVIKSPLKNALLGTIAWNAQQVRSCCNTPATRVSPLQQLLPLPPPP